MKSVRDSVAGALKLWKNIADPKVDSYITQKIPSSNFLDNENAEMSQNLKNFDIESTSPTASQISSIDKDVMNNAYQVSDYMMSFQGSKSKMDKPVSNLKKRVSNLSDKKLNSEFFQNLKARGLDN